MVNRGISRCLGRPPKQKLPITPALLLDIFSKLDDSSPQHCTFWAACLVAFFAFLRKSTLLPKSASPKDTDRALCIKDVNVSKSHLTLRIRHTKTIQFGQRELDIPLVEVPGSPLCPVRAVIKMLSNLASCKTVLCKDTPLFCYVSNGKLEHLNHATFTSLLKKFLICCNVNPGEYSGHSFRRGGCTHAFNLGISPLLIKLRGDWKSNVYERYVNIAPAQHFMLAKSLALSV